MYFLESLKAQSVCHSVTRTIDDMLRRLTFVHRFLFELDFPTSLLFANRRIDLTSLEQALTGVITAANCTPFMCLHLSPVSLLRKGMHKYVKIILIHWR